MGKSEIPLFPILSISCQKEYSLIWSILIWTLDCSSKITHPYVRLGSRVSGRLICHLWRLFWLVEKCRKPERWKVSSVRKWHHPNAELGKEASGSWFTFSSQESYNFSFVKMLTP